MTRLESPLVQFQIQLQMTCGCRGWVSQSGYFLGLTFEVGTSEVDCVKRSDASPTIRIYWQKVFKLLAQKAVTDRCNLKS